MRILVQRVTTAQVTVDGEVVGRIDPAATGAPHGLLALVGVTHSDTEATAKLLADKLFHLRILDGERSADELSAPILVVSQFTLYADTRKGRRPSWNAAAPGAAAEPLVAVVTARLRELGAEVATGRFGAHMQIGLVNDGPVTVLLESPEAEPRS
ncbi:D-aminoacyl-tRNA deacylase [Nocardia stercoris]|uniref:D-aminoacyl-tRNA deacylase n=1 Tax=Nocardia stercoris TaxID=2483361 RepID=A0A3M2L2A8_9NOCA|nr:D-aminoacyl-tRNA deacylase [Nocardia stercoris]RMI31859.1 D-tyrosyl-tRNA(Tyr) deacylase [Nocardia stercoris]